MADDRESKRAERQRRIERAREAYAREHEKKRAARGGPVKIPPLDPVKFVGQLQNQSKASLHTVLYAAVLTTALVLLARAVGAQAFGAFAALLLIGSLYYYLKIVWDVDLSKLGKPTATVGVWLTYFVTWLMVSFLLSNPPFFDEAPPVVHCCSYLDNPDSPAQWVPVNGTTINDTDGVVRVTAQVFDNAAISGVTLDLGDPSGAWTNGTAMQRVGDGAYSLDLTGLHKNGYTVVARAIDTSGNHGSSDFKSFTIA